MADPQDAARRGLSKIEALIASLPADELEAIRAVAASAADDDGDVEAFGMGYSSSVFTVSGSGGPDDMMAALMAYQRMTNGEARQDRKLGRSHVSLNSAPPRWKP